MNVDVKMLTLASIYLIKVNNGNTRTIREICLRRYYTIGVFIVNFEQISNIVWVFSLLSERVSLFGHHKRANTA